MFSVDWEILLIPELVIWGTEAWGRENSGKWGRIHGLSALSGLSSTVVCIPLSFPPHQPIILIHCFLERSSFTFYCTRRKLQVVIRLGVMNGVAIIKSKLYLAKKRGVKKKCIIKTGIPSCHAHEGQRQWRRGGGPFTWVTKGLWEEKQCFIDCCRCYNKRTVQSRICIA